MSHKARAMFCNQLTNSANILRFCAIEAGATDSEPLKLGNAEFWIGDGSWNGQMIHYPESYSWDREAVQEDLNRFLVGKEEALRSYMGKAWALGLEHNIEVTK